MNQSLRLGILSLAVPMSLTLTMSAQAETILIDFGSSTSFRGASVPAPDVNGNRWTSVQPGVFYENIVNSAGTPTTLDIGFSTPVATDSFNGPAGAVSFPPTAAQIAFAGTEVDAAALGNLGVAEAVFDFAAGPDFPPVAGVPGNVVRFEIQGLDPALRYDLRFFGSHKFSTDSTTRYTVFSDNSYTTPVASGDLAIQSAAEPWMHNRDKTVTLSNLAPQADNIFYVQFVGVETGNNGYLNALEITSIVPEPAAASLLALPALILRRRR